MQDIRIESIRSGKKRRQGILLRYLIKFLIFSFEPAVKKKSPIRLKNRLSICLEDDSEKCHQMARKDRPIQDCLKNPWSR